MITADESTPWWQRELASLSRALAADLRLRIPQLASEHEDIVQETLFDLSRWLESDAAKNLPASWFAVCGDPPSEDKARFTRTAHAILRRRIADRFRGAIGAWARASTSPIGEGDLRSDERLSPERAVWIAQLLRACVEVLSEASQEERLLVLSLAGAGASAPEALDPTARKRLQRLRRRLERELVRRFGERAAEMMDLE